MATIGCGSNIVNPGTTDVIWCDEPVGHAGRHWHMNVSWRKGHPHTVKTTESTVPKKIKISNTERGFAKGEFLDLYGQKCSIQKSSLATADAIWLGVDVGFKPEVLKNSPAESGGPTFPVGARMHLDRKKVKALLPMLIKFSVTGDLEV